MVCGIVCTLPCKPCIFLCQGGNPYPKLTLLYVDLSFKNTSMNVFNSSAIGWVLGELFEPLELPKVRQ